VVFAMLMMLAFGGPNPAAVLCLIPAVWAKLGSNRCCGSACGRYSMTTA